MKILCRINPTDQDRSFVSYTRKDVHCYYELVASTYVELFVAESDGNERVYTREELNGAFGREKVSKALSDAIDERRYILKYPVIVNNALSIAFQTIVENGFVSEEDALKNEDLVSTLDCVWDDLYDQKIAEKDVSKEIKECLKDTRNNEIKDLLKLEYCRLDVDVLNVAIEAANRYKKHLDQEDFKKFHQFANWYVGAENETIKTPVDALVLSVEEVAGYMPRDVENKVMLKTKDHEVLCWQTSSDVNFKAGDTVRLLRFTVKKHFESKGHGKVTRIIRPKFAF